MTTKKETVMNIALEKLFPLIPLEDDYGMIDGIINNGEKSKEQPPSKASLLDKLHEKKQEAEKTNQDRPMPERNHSQDRDLN